MSNSPEIKVNMEEASKKDLRCPECPKAFMNQHQLKDHKREYHSKKCRVWLNDDGTVKPLDLSRTEGVFICPVCNSTVSSRSGIIKHTDSHLDKQEPQRPNFVCNECGDEFESAEKLEEHLHTHSERSVISESSSPRISDLLKTAREEIDSETTLLAVTDCFLDIMSSFSCTHKSGHKSIVLMIPPNAKRAATDPIVSMELIRHPKKFRQVDPLDLSTMLSVHQYGNLVGIDHYCPLESNFFRLDYTKSKFEIAKKLAGAVIQTSSQAILIGKVEVYGRRPGEDAHYFNLAMPAHNDFEVVSLLHDNCYKLIIGSNTWSALVTESIELLSGSIEVGADNGTALSSDKSTIWGRDDWEKNSLAERQLRSKFNNESTYEDSAAIFYQLIHWSCQPITIFRLRDYYESKAMCGIKASALIFNQILVKRYIEMALLEKLVQDDGIRAAPATKIAIQNLLKLFASDEKKLKVLDSAEASTILTNLASGLCNTIHNLNEKQVKNAVRTTINTILHAKLQEKQKARKSD
ncbi:hypothetical protein BGZ76_003150 [Entomortierella beljakovae]|nr:hypothetical protein BGZ76_003150 [Entomortierella beljakovae]